LISIDPGRGIFRHHPVDSSLKRTTATKTQPKILTRGKKKSHPHKKTHTPQHITFLEFFLVKTGTKKYLHKTTEICCAHDRSFCGLLLIYSWIIPHYSIIFLQIGNLMFVYNHITAGVCYKNQLNYNVIFFFNKYFQWREKTIGTAQKFTIGSGYFLLMKRT